MATVKKGTLSRAPQWWVHLKDWKRVFWKRERQATQRDINQRQREGKENGNAETARGTGDP